MVPLRRIQCGAMNHKKIIVVGAGLSGLAAAQRLQVHGFAVKVLERNARVGGRVHSQAFHGRIIECGAQFPSTGYRHLPALLAKADIATSPCSPWAAFERAGRWHRVHQNRPATLWSGGLLGAAEFVRLGWGVQSALRRSRQADTASYASFAEFDDEGAVAWCDRVLGAAAASAVFDPSVHGFYFHPLAGSSRALLHALLAFHGAQALAVPTGWDSLPRAMASGLSVQTGVAVDSVEAVTDGVRVHANGECLHADAAVLAVPSPIGRALLQSPTPQECALLRTGYASAIHVALGLAAGWPLPAEWRDVHGLLLGSGSLVASLVVEQSRVACAAPEVITLMLGDTTARRFEACPDATVLQEVLAWLRARWPTLPQGVTAHRIHRWPLAEPLSPPGRARAVQAYRDTLPAGSRIVLCGDGTGLPWTDGAVDSGLWAAARLAERLS